MRRCRSHRRSSNWLWWIFMQASPGADAALAGLDTLDQRADARRARRAAVVRSSAARTRSCPPRSAGHAAKLAPRGRVAEFERLRARAVPRGRAAVPERRCSSSCGASTERTGGVMASQGELRALVRLPQSGAVGGTVRDALRQMPRSDRGSRAPGLRFGVAHRAPLLRRRLHAVAAGDRRRDRRAHAAACASART